jgi:hypothetical protein
VKDAATVSLLRGYRRDDALTVSRLGIVAITWIGVKERTHEIGTRRATSRARRNPSAQRPRYTATLASLLNGSKLC